jgi:hypothetical protein
VDSAAVRRLPSVAEWQAGSAAALAVTAAVRPVVAMAVALAATAVAHLVVLRVRGARARCPASAVRVRPGPAWVGALRRPGRPVDLVAWLVAARWAALGEAVAARTTNTARRRIW